MEKNDNTQWVEIKINEVGNLREFLINRMFEVGIVGVIEEDASDSISGYFPKTHKSEVIQAMQEYIRSLKTLFPTGLVLNCQINNVINSDWVSEYQKSFVAQPLSDHFFLVPSWDTKTKVGFDKTAIIMEASQAFGTGLHATTRLCLRALESAVSVHSDPATLRYIDVGTGTGILSIAGEKLGIGKIIAIDNDPVAIQVAQTNCERNGCNRIELCEGSLENISGKFDIILSNILLETHRELAKRYRDLLAPRGVLIVSGLLGYQIEEICEEFKVIGLRLESSRVLQEWAALTFVETQE